MDYGNPQRSCGPYHRCARVKHKFLLSLAIETIQVEGTREHLASEIVALWSRLRNLVRTPAGMSCSPWKGGSLEYTV